MPNCDCVPVRLCLDELPAASSGLPVYPGMFMSFFEQTPPDGWEMRDGRILYNADRVYPELWNELLKPKNAWKLKSDEEWEEMSLAASGVGGVPFFALNQQTKTIRLPDTRGDYERGIGGGTMSNVGDWHEDAIRNITGHISSGGAGKTGVHLEASGALYPVGTNSASQPGWHSTGANNVVKLDTSLVVPTAEENRTRAFGMLPCVYVGRE